jgi:hypothetical protein
MNPARGGEFGEWTPRPEQVLLAEKFSESTRPHTRGERLAR